MTNRRFWLIAAGMIFWLAGNFSSALAGGVTVSWDANTEDDLLGYKIYYGTASRSYDHIIDVGNVVEYDIDNLPGGHTYYFAVTAYDTAFNESDFSEEVSIFLAAQTDSSAGDSTSNTDPGNNQTPPATPPHITDVVVLNLQTLRVYFDQPMDHLSMTSADHYTIQPQVQIVSLTADSTRRYVTIVTSTHSIEVDYTLTIQGVESANGLQLERPYVFHYRFPDTMPPFVTGINLLDLSTIQISFSEKMDVASAKTLANYRIQPSVQIRSIDINAEGTQVTLHTDPHSQSVNYVLTVQNLKDVHGNVMQNPFSVAYSYQEKSPPRIVSIRVRDQQTIEVYFSTKMDYNSVADKSHYTISPKIEIYDVIVDSTLQKVTLRTAKHQAQVNYVLIIQDVRSFQQIPLAQPYEYSYNFEDLLPPYVEKMELLDRKTLRLIFSEPMNEADLKDASHYQISPSKQITAIQPDSTLQVVTLSTEEHEYGVRYTIELTGLRDKAGNEIPRNYSLAYEFTRPARVDSISQPKYQTAMLSEGDTYYVDRDYRLASIPAELHELTWVKTANNDKFSTGDDFLQFVVYEDVIVYVAYDTRLTQLPNWLQNWTPTSYIIRDEDSVSFRCYSKNFTRGKISLGGNYGNDNSYMYLVLVRSIGTGKVEYPNQPQEKDDLGGSHPAQDFELLQNFPNPFNPSTAIPFIARKEGQVQLKIYDSMGRQIRTIEMSVSSPGRYHFVWDGRSDDGNLCGSGIYLYLLKTESFQQTRKMLLVR